MKSNDSGGKLHRAWIVLIGCCLMNCGTAGITNCIGLFYKPLSEAFSTAEKVVGISDAALGRTLQQIVVAFFVIFCSRLLIKYYKRTLFISSVFYLAHYILLSFSTSMVHIYIIQGLAGLPIAVLQNLCIVFTLNKWFYKKKGLAFSIYSACAGVSSMIFNSVAGNIIASHGWQWGYRFFGICGFVLTFTAAILMQPSPAYCGLRPYGWDDEAEAAVIAKAQESTDSRPLWKRPELYLMIYMVCSFQFLMASTTHCSTFARSIGYGLVAAAYISSVGFAGNTGIKLVLGAFRDKFGTKRAGLLEFALSAAGYLLLIFSRNIVMLLAGIFLVGSVISTATVISPVLQSDLFKGADFDRAYPITNMFASLIGAFSNYFYGWVYDSTGSYLPIFIICLSLLAVDTGVIMVLGRIIASGRKKAVTEEQKG